MTGEVRCRFAPAPSGSLHVGNVRSALFSWLFARHQGGTFILRVEDTDASRVTEEAVHGVLEDLRWLGLDWDEGPEVGGDHGPYRQSQRLDIYREKADELLASGAAYRCYCTKEELEARSAAARARKEAPGYDGHCRDLDAAQIAAYEAEGRESVVRFRMPDHEWVVDDIVKGEVRFAAGQLRDFVLMRSDGSPVFLLAVAVDDLLMGVTHVVRGDDLLASAPEERRGDRSPRRHAASLCPRAAGPRPRPPAPVEAARIHQRRILPRARLPARGHGQLPLAPGLVGGRRPGDPQPRRAHRGVRPGTRLVQPRRVRHREAHLAQQPPDPGPRRRRPRGAMPPFPHRGRASCRIRRCSRPPCRW